MITLRWGRILGLVVVLAAAPVVGACGGGGKAKKPPVPTTTVAAPSTTDAAPSTTVAAPSTSVAADSGAPTPGAPGAGSPTTVGELVPETEEAWLTTVEDLELKRGDTREYACPGGGDAEMGSAYGTDTYEDDSSICVAAVHAGIITPQAGGTVRVRVVEGLAAYPGSERNGVTSEDAEDPDREYSAFVFVR